MNNLTRDVVPSTVGSVVALVLEQISASPRHPAVETADERVSYAELGERSSELAARLVDEGVGRGTTVAVLCRPSPSLVVSLLAVLRAGGAIVPLDMGYPSERVARILRGASPAIVVTETSLLDHFQPTPAHLAMVDQSGVSQSPAKFDRASRADLAYVMFTSGSTGQPKGVAMPHGPLCDLLVWQRQQFRRSRGRTLQLASPAFDVGFQDIFSALTTGSTIVAVEQEARRDFDALAERIDRDEIDRLFVTPRMLRELAERLGPSDREVDVFLAGEQLEVTDGLRQLGIRRPQWRFQNQYGPAETHVVTAHDLAADARTWPTYPPIGVPLPGVVARITDDVGQERPVGEPGELWIGGAALADGYLRDPALTEERFVVAPGPGPSRFYRTGDLAFQEADGTIAFLGRSDDQLKVRGHRVEPGEVVAALVAHPAVLDAAVLPDGPPTAARRLVGYLVCSQAEVDLSEIRREVARRLPPYMVPASLVVLDRLPLTNNGKLDRAALAGVPVPTEVVIELEWTEAEQVVATAWAEALGQPTVGLDDDFFQCGGDSLLAGEVVAACARELAVPLPIRALFAHPTVRGLAAEAERLRRDGAVAPVIPRAVRRPFDAAGPSAGDPHAAAR